MNINNNHYCSVLIERKKAKMFFLQAPSQFLLKKHAHADVWLLLSYFILFYFSLIITFNYVLKSLYICENHIETCAKQSKAPKVKEKAHSAIFFFWLKGRKFFLSLQDDRYNFWKFWPKTLKLFLSKLKNYF